MKLNPPASSSDLEIARATARRLHDRARQPEGSEPGPASPAPEPPGTEAVAAPEAFRPPDYEPPMPEPEPSPVSPLTPEAAAPEPEPPVMEEPPPVMEEPPPATEEPPPPMEEPPPFVEEPTPAVEEPPSSMEEPPPAVEEPPPDVEEPPSTVEEPPSTVEEPPPAIEEQPPPGTGDESPLELADDAPAGEPPSPPEAWAPPGDDALSELAPPPEATLEGLEPPGDPFAPADDALSPEDLLGEAPPPEAILDESGAAGEEPERAPDDLVAAPGPSWDDVADACLALARARGAMLVDPGGQVLTARGDWPEPGPDAIAGRLVSMMERTLQDAPTRSVSAPIAGQHLTAWRIPASEGYLTVVFMGEAPLSADERPGIDDHIRQALDV